MGSTIPSAMTQEGSDNSAETKPPRSWSWLWFRPIQLQGLATSERRVIRRSAFSIKHIRVLAFFLMIVLMVSSAITNTVPRLIQQEGGSFGVVELGLYVLSFSLCWWFALAIFYLWRIQGALEVMGFRICDTCGQRAELESIKACRECDAEIKNHLFQLNSVSSLPRFRAALAQCNSNEERSALRGMLISSWRRPSDWLWAASFLACVGFAFYIVVMIVLLIPKYSDPITGQPVGGHPLFFVSILIGGLSLIVASIFCLSLLVESRAKTSIERASIRLCRRCLNRAYDESQTKCEACQMELKEPGPMRSKIAN